jgi:hypothetical protein
MNEGNAEAKVKWRADALPELKRIEFAWVCYFVHFRENTGIYSSALILVECCRVMRKYMYLKPNESSR